MSLNEQELNKKLAKWSGFEIHEQETRFEHQILYREPNQEPSRGWRAFDIRFTESLDACFKWLTPKLHQLGWNIKLFSDEGYYFAQVEKQDMSDEWSSIISVLVPALAFCLAVELLVDEESTDASR